MPDKNIFKGIVAVLLLTLFCGCSVTEGVKVQSYLEDRTRVDQQMYGNAGYLLGAPQEGGIERKKTRKIYVVEFTKESEDVSDEDVVVKRIFSKSSSGDVLESSREIMNSKQADSYEEAMFYNDLKVLNFEDDVSAEATTYEMYTIEKGDTLQKISNKFYGCYSKWTVIYAANKNKIKSPDSLVVGMVIKIPLK